MTAPIQVLIADDHPVFRDGLASLLEPENDFTVVGRAADGLEAVELAVALRPDVVIMDISMPRMDGLAATRQVREQVPEAGVLVVTMGEDDATIAAAMQAGARGYLLKEAGQEEVTQAIRTVHGGGMVFGAALADRIARGWSAPTPAAVFPELTEREREILAEVAAGLANPEIARRLHLAPKTVRNNVSAIMAKLQVADRPALIVRAREAGLIRTR